MIVGKVASVLLLLAETWSLCVCNPLKTSPQAAAAPDSGEDDTNVTQVEAIMTLMKAVKKLTNAVDRLQITKLIPPPSPSVLRYYKDCDDAYSNGHKDSTVYLIQPDQQPPFEVYCEMDTEGKRGWTVIQRRQQGNESFNRGWSEYREGFGNHNGDFWLGLEKIYRLTASAQDTLLQVNMTDFEGGKAFATYSHFSLGPGTTEYKLVISGYNGTAGDTLNEVNNAPFSSKDNDNDFSTSLSVNCAAERRGGWWYRGNSCGTSNLNGEYLAGKHGSSRRGIYWHYFKGSTYSLKTSQMMLLRKY